MNDPFHTNPSDPVRAPWGAWAVVMGILAVLVVPMIWLDLTRPPVPPQERREEAHGYPSELLDQEWYHRGVIETMASQWPRVNVVSYDSATTPGYHFIQATVLRVTGAWLPVHIVNALIGGAYVSVVYLILLSIVRSGWRAAALAAPVLLSPYTIGGSIWMTTDNLCWMFVALTVAGAALRRFTVARGALLSVYATCAVLVRQIHVWPIAIVGLAGLLRSPLARFAPRALRDDARQSPRAWRFLVVGAIGAAIPAVVLLLFIRAWGGLLPASDRIRILHVDGPNWATPAFALAAVATVAVFMAPLVWSEVRRIRPTDGVVWMAALLGLGVALVPATSYLSHPRSGGWIWQAVRRLPAPMDRSMVLACAAPVGAILLVVLYRGAARAGNAAPALMILLASLGWVCAQTMSTMAWQRYFDPMVLIVVPMLGALGVTRETPRWAWAAPVALGALQALLSIATLHVDFVQKVMEATRGG